MNHSLSFSIRSLGTLKQSAYVILAVIMLLGFLLRLLFILHSDHVFHPDEIFQTLEPAHRLVYGYGIIPWDYLYGLRSFVIPLLLSLPLILAKLLDVTTPAHYLFFVRLFLVLCSLILIPFAYRLVYNLTRDRRLALLSSFTTAIWYELIYFSPRALTETLAVYLYAFAFCLPSKHRWHDGLYSFIITAALFTRPQYFSLYLLFFWLRFFSRKAIALYPAIVGGLMALLLFGLVDHFFYGRIFISLIRNIELSYQAGISALFGTQPTSFYLTSLLITSFGLILFLPAALKYPATKPYLYAYLAVLSIHSLVPHKEYRFIFALLALGLPLMTLGTHGFITGVIATRPSKIASISVVGIFSLISIFGMRGALPYQARLYIQPPLYKDPVLSLLTQLPANDGCGIALPDRDWVWTGGYVYLHQNVPLYSHDLPATIDHPPQYLILPTNLTPPEEYQMVHINPSSVLPSMGEILPNSGYTVYRSAKPCSIPPPVDHLRSFSYLEPILKNILPLYDPP